jgi:hypothetical protein
LIELVCGKEGRRRRRRRRRRRKGYFSACMHTWEKVKVKLEMVARLIYIGNPIRAQGCVYMRFMKRRMPGAQRRESLLRIRFCL